MNLSDLNMLLHNLYQTLIPKRIYFKIAPILVKVYVLFMAIFWVHRKKKRLDNVEVRITDHCNLNCISCIQFSPLATPTYIDTKTFIRDFQRLHALTGGDIKTIKLMGGEPLLHPQLQELMQAVREIFNKNRIVLVTNGILLSKQGESFWETCKGMNIEIAISHYPINIGYQLLLDTSKKYNVKLRYGSKEPQLMYKWAFDVEGKQNAKKNFYKCYWGNNCIQIDNGRLYNCHVIPCIKHFNDYFDKNMQVMQEDSVDIYDVENINTIFNFLAKPVPFCRYCMVGKNQYGKKWEPSKKDILEWT